MLEGFGFGPEQLAAIQPGIINLSISCFGFDGPLSHRAGWESVAETLTGICNGGHLRRHSLLSAPACGSVTGYLGAYQVLLALTRRALLMSETQPHWVRPTSTLGYNYPEQID